MSAVGLIGHADVPEAAMPELQRLMLRALVEWVPADGHAKVRAGAGAPLAFTRAAAQLGVPIELVLPVRQGGTTRVVEGSRGCVAEMMLAARRVETVPVDRDDPGAWASMERAWVGTCGRVLAAWDGAPGDPVDLTADLVAYTRGRGGAVGVVWPEGAARSGLLALQN
jgi:hypothetical protein